MINFIEATQKEWPFLLGLFVGNCALQWLIYKDLSRGLIVGALAAALCAVFFWVLRI